AGDPADLRRARRPGAVRRRRRRAAGRRRAGGGDRVEAVPQPGFRETAVDAGRRGGVRWPQPVRAGRDRGGRDRLLRHRARALAARGMTMSELETRLVDLETRLAFQEHALQELSDALAAARGEESRN